MLDQFGFPRSIRGDVQIFYGGQATDNIARHWKKPKNCTMLYMFTLGGGGGGGGGFSAAAGNTRGGGGGGGSGGIARLFIPALFVPDSLFIKVGNGGAGSTGSGVPGTAGTRSYIFTRRGSSVTAENVMLVSSNGTANGGGAGTGAAAGSAGASVSATSITQARGTCFGIFLSQAGVAGAAGGVHTGANGADKNPLLSAYVGGGCGGGGVGTANTNTAGGSGTGQVDSHPFIQGGFVGTRDPQAGLTLWPPHYPFCASGGTGGGSNGTGTGQRGADGGIGCGGGGGGGGVTGGGGGRGGDGIVIIAAW